MHYLDTSAAVAAHTPEVATSRMQEWLGRSGSRGLTISRWVLTEFSSAMSVKIRTGALTADQRARVLDDWRQFVAEDVRVLDVKAADFDLAATMAERHHLALRAGDALHLAIASRAGCTLVTLDDRMAKAAPELGVTVAEV